MDEGRKKDLIRQYKETPRDMGVYRVRNVRNEKALIGASRDVQATLNRHRFQLQTGSHSQRQLQDDWKTLGPDVFLFEVLDTLEPREAPTDDPTEDLRALERLWLEKLAPSGDPGYPTRPGLVV